MNISEPEPAPAVEPTDIELVVRIQAGDDAAFDVLMGRYKRPVLSFVYRMTGEPDASEDIAQEVFVRVYRHIGTYKPRGKFTTWMFQLAHNAAVDHLRWRKRHPSESLDDDSKTSSTAAASHDVVRDVAIGEIGEQVAAAVALLPDDQRTVLVLAEYHGLSYADIAETMKCTIKSVEARLYRAKLTLRERLHHFYEDARGPTQ